MVNNSKIKNNEEKFSLAKYNFTFQYFVYGVIFVWIGWMISPNILTYFSFIIAAVCFILEFISPYAFGNKILKKIF